nr:hypothetical protein [uncultured Desulfobulbus sp.]
MKIRLHKQARTTPAIRAEIQSSDLSERVLAEKYGISRSTVRKWKNRQSVEDNSHRPLTIHTVLKPGDELAVVALRLLLFLPLDDLLLVTRVFVQPAISRSALDRCLRRYGISKLSGMVQQCGQYRHSPPPPGVLSIAAIDLSPLLKAAQPHILYLAVDLPTRWLYAEIRSSHTATAFLHNLLKKIPFTVHTIHTPATPEFSIPGSEHQPQQSGEGQHPFDLLCNHYHLVHHLHDPHQAATLLENCPSFLETLRASPYHGSLGQVREIVADFCAFFNAELPLKCLHHRSPLQTLHDWQTALSNCGEQTLSAPSAEQHPSSRNLHRSSEAEELFRLRHANHCLRLEQALLKAGRTN